jgi:DNA-binding GntR family transcriptional regulator
VRDAIEQHREVLSALEEGDAARAETLVQAHIVDFQRNIKAAL